ncbi:hypothetical protein [Desulfoluna sp.]|uniref:hypothetical protein n=1 Tax=Desulfoluna sp. TaxID=2045199 RepID=UPI00261DE11E|nr:hypothetical protein [Desulfoluna sp.]
MKLNSIQPLGPTVPTSPAGSVKTREGSPSFGQMLNQATQASVGPAETPASPAAALAVAPLGEIRSLMPSMTSGMPSPAAEGTVALLNLLENYAQKMESDEVPLKEVASLVGEMGTLAKALAASLGDEPDPRIRELAEQSAALAGIESVKFSRGDYL